MIIVVWAVMCLVGAIQSVEVLIVPTLKAMLSKAVPAQDKGEFRAPHQQDAW